MNTTDINQHRRWDVRQVRTDHPIADVIAASGVQLSPRGRGFAGCCPFHDDSTPSLSVGAVPDRFHCFGCGASGDVIDYVSRLTGMPFLASVRALADGAPFAGQAPSLVPVPVPLRAVPTSEPATTPERAYQVNQLAWEHFAAPPAAAHAQAWLRHHRGIDLTALTGASGGQPLVGYASTNWHGLTAYLRARGVSDTELVDLDLAHRPRTGAPIDSYRGRLILPVRDTAGRIQGFLGRDTTGHPGASKYRNPTHTPVFDKAAVLYRPTQHDLGQDGTVVVVEGALDALAIAAAAATAAQTPRFAPCATSGVTVSPAQADVVLALHPSAPVIALDADPAGHQGTLRWLRLICITGGRPALVTSLPQGRDPADWLGDHGDSGLAAFDLHCRPTTAPGGVVPHQPGRELVHACLDLTSTHPADQTLPAVLAVLVPLAAQLPEQDRHDLLADAEREMTAQGWNPRNQFSRALRQAVHTTLWQHPSTGTPGPAPPSWPGRPTPENPSAAATASRGAAPSLT